MKKITESDSHYNSLEKMSTDELLLNINKEDNTVPLISKSTLSQILSNRKLKLYHNNYFPYELTTDRKCLEENYDSVMSE